MRIYLARHGHAVSAVENPDRPLSLEGRDEVGRMAAFMARAGIRVDRIVHSGKARAAETAVLYAQAIGGGTEPEAVEGLQPNDEPSRFATTVDGLKADTLIAGHMPHLGRLAQLLVTGVVDLPLVSLETGSVVCLERGDSEDDWWIVWMMEPSLLG